MDRLVPNLKTKYRERRISVEQKQPWSHESNRLVRLQLVRREKPEGSYTGIQRERTPLTYCDLFKTGGCERKVRKVLVEGGAGIGKTTFTTSLSEDWACDKLLEEFELLLLLPLRHHKVASAHSLCQLLYFFS